LKIKLSRESFRDESKPRKKLFSNKNSESNHKLKLLQLKLLYLYFYEK